MKFGENEGEICNRDGCAGTMIFPETENCSCHISPPCRACTDKALECSDCGHEIEFEPFNDHVLTVYPKTRKIESYKLRELDNTKIDWHSFSHSNSSMIKRGVYPSGTGHDEVRKLVDGTFGGRFNYFGDGKFEFVAYTD
jgi:hypothetical protein